MNLRNFCSILVRLTIFQNLFISHGMPHYIPVFGTFLQEGIHLRTKRAILNMVFSHCDLRFYIILSWCIGLILGLHIIPLSFHRLNLALHSDYSGHRHFLSLLLTSFIPLMLTFFCIQFKKVYILPILCFLKATFFGFSLFLMRVYFSSGAWLAAILFLFTDLVNVCLLLWFWLRQGKSSTVTVRKDTIILSAILICTCCFDHFAISPFLQRVI